MPADMRVLDFGCGRGDAVVHLLSLGYRAHGCDLAEASEALADARRNVAAAGFDPDEAIGTIRGGHAPFPDEGFDFVFSQEVLEHVVDLHRFVAEIARLTAPGGGGFHVFPARLRPIEGHLLMPCVHFLPKNNLRRAAIHAFTIIGVEPPHPPELPAHAVRRERAEFQYRYSVDHTFYRPHREIIETFRQHGLVARSDTTGNRRFERAPRLQRPPVNAVVDWAFRTFASENLVVEKQVRS
jgi:SAM-dependent methyltransferase